MDHIVTYHQLLKTQVPIDVIVVGGGHAGVEAALAAARMQCTVVMITMDSDKIGWMPCNPSIGGPAKGQIVGEIDALGGEMGVAADSTMIQMKVLNRSRGPAVQCLRSQNDKLKYNDHMKNKIASTENIYVLPALVNRLVLDADRVTGVMLNTGETLNAKTVIVTTGTFLKGKIHTGLTNTSAGRIDEPSAEYLSDHLRELGFRLGRLKTGTPPRLHRESINYNVLERAPGDDEWRHFSFKTPYNERYKHQEMCYLTSTNPETHQIILNHLDESPMFQKVITGSGARYCPSIEDKIFRFADKESHHVFIEPETIDGDDMYPQGLNTSLPEKAQDRFLRSMKGLEKVEITRWGYAVEYDFVYPDQLKPTLETRAIRHLFLAGQLNGTSGYEEAAGQGIIAGINAACCVKEVPSLILTRENSYIGTMIDDLITKNVYEPYRMLTSRSEYRLLLRQDNPTSRISEYAYERGLLTDNEICLIRSKNDHVKNVIKRWKKTSINDALIKKLDLNQRMPLYQVLKRPEIDIKDLIENGYVENDPEHEELARRAIVEIKYEGYIQKQEKEIEKIQRYEKKKIPQHLDFSKLTGLKKESIEKFEKYRPETVYEAKRIAGINPADILVLIALLERKPANINGRIAKFN